MTAQHAVLLLGTITLAGCGAGLVLVHESNPLLKGLNWMGAALVAAAAGAGATMAASGFPALEPLANFCILLAFVCCYRADRNLLGLDSKFGSVSISLLCGEALTASLQWVQLLDTRAATVILSVLLAIQIGTTAALIQKNRMGKTLLAAKFTVGLMGFLLVANLARAVCAGMGLMGESPLAAPLNLLTYNIFVSSAVGLAFAFFWRTTAKLSLELQHMASTDPLTRVYNRRVFLTWCESEQARTERLHAPFSVLMLDFDHFKRINDTYGHHVGDQVLCAAVERIQDSIRGIDVLCRWGGEEFTVLLPNASEEATLIVAERVRRNLRLVGAADPRFAEESFAHLELSASIGTATFDGEGDDFHQMLQRADEALYEAKRTGRNRVVRSSRSRTANRFGSGQLAFKA